MPFLNGFITIMESIKTSGVENKKVKLPLAKPEAY